MNNIIFNQHYFKTNHQTLFLPQNQENSSAATELPQPTARHRAQPNTIEATPYACSTMNAINAAVKW